MTAQTVTENEGSLEDLLGRVVCGEFTYTAADDYTGSAALWGPDLVDVNDPAATVGGSVHVDLTAVTAGRFDDASAPAVIDDALRVAVALTLAHHLHEIAEWMTVDGQRVFDVHTTDRQEWQTINAAASAAAEHFVRAHPRRAL